jgi:hypothetical protein
MIRESRLTLVIIGVPIALILFIIVVFRLVNHTNGTLVSSSEKRAYLLYIPESYDPSVPTRLSSVFMDTQNGLPTRWCSAIGITGLTNMVLLWCIHLARTFRSGGGRTAHLAAIPTQ